MKATPLFHTILLRAALFAINDGGTRKTPGSTVIPKARPSNENLCIFACQHCSNRTVIV